MILGKWAAEKRPWVIDPAGASGVQMASDQPDSADRRSLIEPSRPRSPGEPGGRLLQQGLPTVTPGAPRPTHGWEI